MTREEFAQFLDKFRDADKNGQDTDAIVKAHEKHNVYFYNDACIKKILASEKNIALSTDLINAALNFNSSFMRFLRHSRLFKCHSRLL